MLKRASTLFKKAIAKRGETHFWLHDDLVLNDADVELAALHPVLVESFADVFAALVHHDIH